MPDENAEQPVRSTGDQVHVLLAAIGVFGTKTGWPDIAVASIMAFLGLSAAHDIIGRARSEIRSLKISMS
jgi:Co/Zn/Cd efflux system component